jgi:hypothetical protein
MDTTKLIVLYVVSIGANGIPNGHLFAQAMADGVSLDTHMKLLSVLKKVGWIEESHYFLTLTQKGLAKHGEFAAILLDNAPKS